MNELPDSEKSRQGHEAFQTFAAQFGELDPFTIALIDVLLGEIYETVPLPGSSGQENDQDVERE